MTSHLQVTRELIQAGQARPYADTIYEGTLEVRAWRDDGYLASGSKLAAEHVKRHLRAFHEFVDPETDEGPFLFEPKLVRFELVEETGDRRVWAFKIIREYDG